MWAWYGMAVFNASIWVATEPISQHEDYAMIEFIGTACGILGAFSVALKWGAIGYPIFICSSLCLLISAVQKGQRNFIVLQSVFLVSNVIGVYNYALR